MRMFAGASSRGELLAECAAPRAAAAATSRGARRLHVQYAANMSIGNVTIEADGDARAAAGRPRRRASAAAARSATTTPATTTRACARGLRRGATGSRRRSRTSRARRAAAVRAVLGSDPLSSLPKPKEEDNTWLLVLFSIGFAVVLLGTVGGFLYWQHLREQARAAARGGSALLGRISPVRLARRRRLADLAARRASAPRPRCRAPCRCR